MRPLFFYAQKEGDSHDKIFRPRYPPSQFGAHDDERPRFPASRRWDKPQQLPLQTRGCRLSVLPALSMQILSGSHLPLYRGAAGLRRSGIPRSDSGVFRPQSSFAAVPKNQSRDTLGWPGSDHPAQDPSVLPKGGGQAEGRYSLCLLGLPLPFSLEGTALEDGSSGTCQRLH